MATEHPLIVGLQWILANRKNDRGAPMAASDLSTKAGITRTHVSGILNGHPDDPDKIQVQIVRKLARAANVRVCWLLTGHGPREPFEGDRISEMVTMDGKEARFPRLHSVMVVGLDREPDRWSEATVRAAWADVLSRGVDPGVDECELMLDMLEKVYRERAAGRLLRHRPAQREPNK